ncbi:MAG: LD-carboxypeptidase [Ruminococcaceae bacterium]|nr:LD-carboxypeptidase [Oscillospiraceae bacterium]
MKMIYPPRLEKGGTIGIAAPCSAPNTEKLGNAISAFEQMGYRVKLSEHIYSTADGYAGSLSERVDDLNSLLRDEGVNAVMLGGGDVGNELLPYIDYNAVVKTPKPVISYSNGTYILNAITSKTGVITYHGQTPRTYYETVPYNVASFNAHIASGGMPSHEKAADWLCFGKSVSAQGKLVGGYLGHIAMMLGGSYFEYSRNEKYILFLGDHHWFSAPETVASYLAHIGQSGFLSCCECVIFGHYGEDQSDVCRVLERFSAQYGISVIKCDDFGHGTYNAVFPIGANVRIEDSQALYYI